MNARALQLGRGAARALERGASGEVELAFMGGGGYVRVGDHRVLVAPPRAPLGPLSLLVAGLGPAALQPGLRASVEPGVALTVGRLRIALPSARAAHPPSRAALRPGWPRALDCALAEAPTPPPELAEGIHALGAGREADATWALAGRGEGLTPAGDDVLAGYAAWLWAEGRELRYDGALGARCAPLGLAYLDCARRGELPEPASRLLDTVRAGDCDQARRRARTLRRWGASSGVALLWGLAAGAGAGARRPREAGSGVTGNPRTGGSQGRTSGRATSRRAARTPAR